MATFGTKFELMINYIYSKIRASSSTQNLEINTLVRRGRLSIPEQTLGPPFESTLHVGIPVAKDQG